MVSDLCMDLIPIPIPHLRQYWRNFRFWYRYRNNSGECLQPDLPVGPTGSVAADSMAADSVAADSVADSGRSSTDSVLSRASPVGMSLQVQEPMAAATGGRHLSASHGSAETLCDEAVPQIPLDALRDGEERLFVY